MPASRARAQSQSEHAYETVVIAPPSAPRAREDVAASSSVITQDRTPRAAETMPQLLSEQAGVTVTRLGGLGAMSTLSLRGSTANQVLVYVDGVPFNSPTGGGVDLGAIPVGDVERIEIYRGTSPIAFGSSGIGGVVSITTLVPKDDRLQLATGGGSFGTWYGDLRASGNRGRVHAYFGFHALTSNGDFSYLDTQGTSYTTADDQVKVRLDNDLAQLDGTARMLVDLGPDRQLSATALVFNRDQGVPGPGTLANPLARLGISRATGILAFDSNRGPGQDGRLRATIYGGFLRSHFTDPAGQINASPTDALDRTISAGGSVDGRRSIRPWLAMAGVLDAQADTFRPSESISSSLTGQPATRLMGAAGVESDFWLAPAQLDIIPSLRVEAVREETSGRDPFGQFLATSSPITHVLPIARLSLVEEIGPCWSVRANSGRYARMPSFIELYGNTGFLVGNPALRPETGINVDVGPDLSWRRGDNQVHWSLAAFTSFVDGLIQYQYGAWRARPRNLGSARVLGVETSANFDWGRHLRFLASATYTDARDTTDSSSYDGRQLSLRPRYRLYARPEYRAIPLGKHVDMGAYGELDVTAGNYVDPANYVAVPTRALFGAGLFVNLPAHFSLRASARNLTNNTVSDLAGYPLPGREFYWTLAWSASNHPTKE